MTGKPKADRPASTWILTAGAAGMINQCLALTDALGIEPAIKCASPAMAWRFMPPWLALPPLATLSPGSDPLEPPFPDLLIACGRRSIGLALAIRRESRGYTYAVYVQDPKLDPLRFDLVVAPNHDRVRGSNVVLTRGAPSRVTPARLQTARARFAPLLASLPRPLVAVLLGGRTRHHRFKPREANALGQRLRTMALERHAGLAITASRRTPPESLAAFRSGLGESPCFLYDGQGENPYFGLLAHADAVVVTADSVNMISDACSTGRPVMVAALEGRPSRRFERFLGAFEADGLIRPFRGRLEVYNYVPLAEASRVAAELLRRFADCP